MTSPKLRLFLSTLVFCSLLLSVQKIEAQNNKILGKKLENLPKDSKKLSLEKNQSSTTSLKALVEVQPIKMRTYYLGVGGMKLLNEYLSPLSYVGMSYSFALEQNSFAYSYHKPEHFSFKSWSSYKALLHPANYRKLSSKILNYSMLQFHLGELYNPAKNAAISSFVFQGDRAWLYRVHQSRFGSLDLGLGLKLDCWLLYQSRNGNNPADIDASLALTGMANYSYRLPLRSCPILFRVTNILDLYALRHGMNYVEGYYFAYGEKEKLWEHIHSRFLGQQWVDQLKLSLDVPVFDLFSLSLAYRYDLNTSLLRSNRKQYQGHRFLFGLSYYFRQANESQALSSKSELCF